MPLTEFTILATCPSCGYGSLRCPSCSKYFEELTVPITEVFGEQLEDIGDVLSDEQIQQLAQSRLVPLSQEARDVLDELLREREHETHRIARDDYLNNKGARWKELYDRHSLELQLRARFNLPEHPFGECCEPSADVHADVAALGITTIGADVGAAEGLRDLDDPESGGDDGAV